MEQMKKFHIELGEPTVVYQGVAGDDKWGHYQFPHLHRTTEGKILLTWSYHNDTVLQDGHVAGAVTNAASDDEGKTWRRVRPEDKSCPSTPMMSNGKRFVGFGGKAGFKADFLTEYPPVAKGAWWVNFVEDLPAEAQPHFTGIEYDPETGKNESFPVTLNWKYMPIQYNSQNILVPVEYIMGITGSYGLLELDGELYYCTYSAGFDSKAESKEQAVMSHSGYYNVYVFKSADNGRTWDYLSQVSVTNHTLKNSCFEGFCEPSMTRMPDGSVVMLMRTGGGWISGGECPSYMVRSTDNCKTWSKPVMFDTCGVLPQILSLDCGVTLATYGRPRLCMRATGDASGVSWEAPIELELSEGPGWRSCYYTHMIPLDENTALLAYSDFHHPQPDGKGEGKAIMVRTIKAVLD